MLYQLEMEFVNCFKLELEKTSKVNKFAIKLSPFQKGSLVFTCFVDWEGFYKSND